MSHSSAEQATNPLAVDLDDDEEECRVCRGPAEPENPLYKPCKCSGSIGLTHQDCLRSWLNVQRGDGRCELCHTKFRFAPRYIENAPDRLPVVQVIFGVAKRAASRWIPFLLRLLFTASLWLVAAPLGSVYLYHAWMHRPSAILHRFSWKLLPEDLVSGAVVIACVIISFLSLMSFADFLRVEMQHRGVGDLDRRRRHGPEEPALNPAVAEIDDELWTQSQQRVLERQHLNQENAGQRLLHAGSLDREIHQPGHNDDDEEDDDTDGDDDLLPSPIARRHQFVGNQFEDEDDEDDDDDVEVMGDDFWDRNSDDGGDDDGFQDPLHHRLDPDGQGRDDGVRRNEDAVLDDNDGLIDEVDVDVQPPLMDADIRRGFNANNFDIDQDDAVEMDLNIALDELLGVRGPIGGVLRNLMWLLAFNTVYIGFFAFTPKLLGSSCVSVMSSMVFSSNSSTIETASNVSETSDVDEATAAAFSSIPHIFSMIEDESERMNTTFRLSDLMYTVVGYMISATVLLLIRVTWELVSSYRGFRTALGRTGNADEVRHALDEINRIMLGAEVGDFNHFDEPGLYITYGVGLVLDVTTAIVKVGVLLVLKMFLLPVVLGFAMDATTLSLLGGSVEERVAHAGQDLFSFLLLHWVAGITFMLLVTVSVLQLREVVHPTLLSQLIRPQEPQPDLLGNLMHETVSTHARRLVLSLIIYAALLSLHVILPILLLKTIAPNVMPLLDIKTWYAIMPQLQLPLELLFFHLCVLGLLERNKNSIGELQHNWLTVIGRLLGLTESVLPQTVAQFRLVGIRNVHDGDEVDPFWHELAKAKREDVIGRNIRTFRRSLGDLVTTGETKQNGERVLQACPDFIRLPIRQTAQTQPSRYRSELLPTKIGRYRLKRCLVDDQTVAVIQLWEEVPGELIPRPPEGWDDLGAGGADIQGRWAWENERKSILERGVAQRRILFDGKKRFIKAIKIVSLLLLSWLAATFGLWILIGGPLAIGRFLYYVLRVPDRYIHDPLAFAVGCTIFFPRLKSFVKNIVCSKVPLQQALRLWASHFHVPPKRKVGILLTAAVIWMCITPVLVGSVIDLSINKPASWFSGQERWIDGTSIIFNWIAGNVVLHVWTDLCVMGVLTRQFWAALFQGAQPAGFQLNDQNVPGVDARRNGQMAGGGDRVYPGWQGKHGRMSKFRELWLNALKFEWDKVDSTVLLDSVVWPITLQVSLAILAPSFAEALLHYFDAPLSGESRAVFVRSVLLVSVVLQATSNWQEKMHYWFEAAHRAAHDDRYLIGEILMNHGEE